MKKGFTLIELLAVIVILAIIALIATPIVLSIINDSKESASLRSAEMYLDSVEYGIADTIMNNKTIPNGVHTIMENGNICIGTYSNKTCTGDIVEVEVNGEVPSEGSTITIESGKITDIELTYSNGKTIVKDSEGNIVYENASTQVYKPQYYGWNISGAIGSDLPTAAKPTVSEINTEGYLFYLGLDTDANNKITQSYICFLRNETEYCLKGWDANAFTVNTEILKDAFSDELEKCTFEATSSSCYSTEVNLELTADSDGNIYANGGIVFGESRYSKEHLEESLFNLQYK